MVCQIQAVYRMAVCCMTLNCLLETVYSSYSMPLGSKYSSRNLACSIMPVQIASHAALHQGLGPFVLITDLYLNAISELVSARILTLVGTTVWHGSWRTRGILTPGWMCRDRCKQVSWAALARFANMTYCTCSDYTVWMVEPALPDHLLCFGLLFCKHSNLL